jgi:hypothetical protein
MLPIAVLDLLQLDRQGAADRAAQGDVTGGRELLLQGLTRAQRAAEGDKPWAAELVRRYQAALAEYDERHGRGAGPPDALP